MLVYQMVSWYPYSKPPELAEYLQISPGMGDAATMTTKARIDILESGTDEEGALGEAGVGDLENSASVGINMDIYILTYINKTKATVCRQCSFYSPIISSVSILVCLRVI